MNMTIITDIPYNYNISNFVLEKDYEFMMNLASLLAYCHCLHIRLLRKTFWDFIIIIQTKDRKTALNSLNFFAIEMSEKNFTCKLGNREVSCGPPGCICIQLGPKPE